MRVPAATLAAVAALFLAACGGDDDGGGRTATVDARADQEIEIVADEYFFDPETVVVTGGVRELTIELENKGGVAHDIRVLDGDEDVGGTPAFPGGQTRTAKVTLPGPGDYELICSVADHEEKGMTGKLTVR